jgi:hypothetical protein
MQNKSPSHFSVPCLHILWTLCIWSWLYLGFYFILTDILKNRLTKAHFTRSILRSFMTLISRAPENVCPHTIHSKSVYPIPAGGGGGSSSCLAYNYFLGLQSFEN